MFDEESREVIPPPSALCFIAAQNGEGCDYDITVSKRRVTAIVDMTEQCSYELVTCHPTCPFRLDRLVVTGPYVVQAMSRVPFKSNVINVPCKDKKDCVPFIKCAICFF